MRLLLLVLSSIFFDAYLIAHYVKYGEEFTVEGIDIRRVNVVVYCYA